MHDFPEQTGQPSTLEINPYTKNRYSQKYYEILETRRRLPVYEHKSEIVNTVRYSPIVIIEGQTGSGKTTQIPQFILEEDLCPGKKIVCTQPRKVAATSIAQRVAEEMDCPLGGVVGYSVRYDDKVSDDTRLVYMTDGLLMREFISDANISKYGVVIIDEAHERTVNTDIIIGILKNIYKTRPDLKIIIMSATLDAGKFVKFFTQGDIAPPLLKVPGRQFNVDVYHEPQVVQNEITAAVNKCMEILESPGTTGDILIFMTGEDEIERACSILRDRVSRTRVTGNLVQAEVFPLYAALQSEKQQLVFSKLPAGTRKVVVSTNIAETSVTIDGIVYVIDCGYVKQSGYSPSSRKSSLNRVFVSKAAANQRKGRAGRTRDGVCYRMYTKEQYDQMEEQQIPEIQRSDLCSVILLMLAAHVSDIVHFPFLDRPHYKLLVGALEELYHLGAFNPPVEDIAQLNPNQILSDIGKMMARLPVEPKYAKALLASKKYGVSQDVVSIVAILSEQGQIFLHPRNKKAEAEKAHKPFMNAHGDHLTLLGVYNQYVSQGKAAAANWARDNFFQKRSLDNAHRAASQLKGILKSMNMYADESNVPDKPFEERFFLALLEGSFMNVARLGQQDKYQIVTGQNQTNAEIKFSSLETSLEDKKWVIFDEYYQTDHDYLRTVSTINPDWLCEAAPTFYVPENFRDQTIAEDIAVLRKNFIIKQHK